MTFMDQDAIIGLVEELVATIFSKVEPLPAAHWSSQGSARLCLAEGCPDAFGPAAGLPYLSMPARRTQAHLN